MLFKDGWGEGYTTFSLGQNKLNAGPGDCGGQTSQNPCGV